MKTKRYEWPEITSQFARFAIGGSLVTLLGAGAYTIAVLLGVAPLVANALSYMIAVLFGYMVHRYWTFSNSRSLNRVEWTMIRFLLSSFVIFGLNTFWVWALIMLAHAPAWLPVVPMIVVTPLIAFAINRLWVFK